MSPAVSLASSTSSSTVPAPVLRVRSLTKTFVGGRALDGLDLDVEAGEVHALLGENGSGKSTLIKILSGYHRPDPGGSVEIGGRGLVFGSAHSSYEIGARFVHQDLGLSESESIIDNLAFGPGYPTRWGTIRSKLAAERARRALQEMDLNVDPRRVVASLSPAQKTGVAVARALLADEGSPVHLLVLDEPTARLPEEEVEHLLGIVRAVSRRGIGVLYVTHRLDEVFQIAGRASVLRDGFKIASEPVEALTRESLLHHLLGSAMESSHRSLTAKSRVGEPTLKVANVSSEVLRNVSVEVYPGEIVGIAGITGSGRDALCATLFGARPRDSGTVTVGHRELVPMRPDQTIAQNVAYVPAERKLHGCFLDLSARENIGIANLKDFWRRPSLSRSAETGIARKWFERFGVRPAEAINQPMSSFSGGNQQKVVFGKWFQRLPTLFLLDEPTQGVDVGAKAELHNALFDAAQSGAAILMSSSDVDELVATCDRVIVLRSGRVVDTLEGEQVTVHSLTRAALGVDDAAGASLSNETVVVR